MYVTSRNKGLSTVVAFLVVAPYFRFLEQQTEASRLHVNVQANPWSIDGMGMLAHRRVTPSSKFAGTHFDTWVKRGTMRVKCLAQGLKSGPFDPVSSALTIRPSHLPYWYTRISVVKKCSMSREM